ncbi:MAG: glycosyltransferase family 4 protein [Bacteroidales bacterium]|nr:glycosyltransferase family 4 protein [Bacteroidales bacterium]
MNIGVIIGRYQDIDGVSLETEKWIHVLKKMGHSVCILSGGYPNYYSKSPLHCNLPSLSFFSPECEWEQKRAFFYPDEDPDELLSHLERTTERLTKEIFRWIVKYKIESLLIENASALPCHLSMGMAIKNIIDYGALHVVTHDHDFAWERNKRYISPHKEVMDIIDNTFPPKNKHVKHAVINEFIQRYLKEKFDLESVVVPNVMDFSTPYAKKDNYNKYLLKRLGLDKNVIPLFQMTRIVKRKGILTAIDLVHRLEDPNIKLVISGTWADDERLGYYKKLLNKIRKHKMQDSVVFANHCISHQRSKTHEGKSVYSLSDAYAYAAACTFFSDYEGFGNAFVEATLAKRPIFVNNYKPVYWPDIGSKGFRTVMIENEKLTDDAVSEIDTIIHNKKLSKEIGEHNFALGKKYFSYEVLEELLTELFTVS